MSHRIVVFLLALVTCICAAGCASGRVLMSAPTISPAGGNFTSIQTVTITATPASATINYTLDGTKPTSSSPVYTSPLTVSTSLTVNAIATMTSTDPSPVATAAFTINLPQTPAPLIAPATGTYTGIQSVSIQDSVSSAAIYYTLDGSAPTATSTPYTGAISVGSTTTVRAIAVASGYTTSAETDSALTILPVGTGTLTGSVQVGKRQSQQPLYRCLPPVPRATDPLPPCSRAAACSPGPLGNSN